MELFLRVHRSGLGHSDVQVDVDPEQPSGRLAAGIAEHLDDAVVGAPPRLLLVRTGEFLDPERPVGETGLVSGDELILNPAIAPAPPPPTPIRAVSVDVLAGPDSGHSAPLDRGSYWLGRGDNCDIIVSDPTVSRSHLRVDVGADWSVTVTVDPATENGLSVNGTRVADPMVVSGDDVVTIGATSLAFREFVRATDSAIDRLGQIEFHRTPYRPERVQERTLDALGPAPTAPERRRFQMFAVIAPIVMGISMVAITGQAQFLLFTLLSPVAMVGSWYDDRKSGRKRHAAAVEKYRSRIASRRDEVQAALAEERIERVRSAPDLADLARRAELRTVDLWPRGREAPDFLTVRLGLGDAPSRVVAKIDRNGDDELRDELESALAGHDRLADVPITVDLAEVGVLGVSGDPTQVDDVVASIATQAACLHSPEDLIIAGAVGADRRFADWLKWLPQARSATTPLSGRHLTTTPDGSRRLLNELIEVADLRTAGANDRIDRRWPWLFVVLDGDLDPDPSLVSQLLDRCPEAGISVMWICTSETRLPRQAAAIVDCQLGRDGHATLWRTDPEIPAQHVELGAVHPGVADSVARSLAPVRDASVASATTAIPRTAPLLSVLGEDDPDAAWVVSRWLTNRPYGLSHPVGLSADGIFDLDLVADGPHALIGGTSGAGKSELLQSMVASLITVYPPTRLNFLFVDYKGGASSTVFRDVPHTVGYVTNLDESLALRALTSLRAELNRRMRIMEGRAKDLEEMLAKHPDEAPASLVIVVDEFATLVKEIPDFVAGIVDIAQRGRSLGIHLVLATQRPSGSVNDNILANTNLRVSLRMLDRAESTAVIDSPEAADIPVPLRGRGYARLGPRALIPFQSAYASAPLLTAGDHERPVVVEDFVLEPADGSRRRSSRPSGSSVSAGADAPTHLDAVLRAVIAAAEECDFPPARTPWREVLPEHVTVAELLADERASVPEPLAGRVLPIGLVDDPANQDQYPSTIDLEEGGGLMIFGSGGSGRTTLLRTIATTAALATSPDDLVVFGIDFASRGLRTIESLPHVAAVGTGDDLETVTRIIALLNREVEQRKLALAELQAETLTAYRERGGELPRIIVLVDGYPNLAAAFSGSGGFGNPLDQWLEAFNRLVLDGRQVGIHVVLTADRRGSVNAIVQSAIANRIILRQSEEAAYADHGIPSARARGLDLEPGRGLWQADRLVQFSCVSDEPDGASQAAEIQRLAAGMPVAPNGPAIRTAPLPQIVELTAVQRRAAGLEVVIGLADLTLDPVTIDLTHANAMIAGLPRSGRSTTAALLAAGLVAGGVEVWAVGPTGCPLAAVPGLTRSAFGRADAMMPVLDELATVVESLPGDAPRVLVIDDLDAIEDASLTALWERLARSDALRVVATVESRSVAGFSMNAMLNEVRKARRILFLQPDDPAEFFQTTGVKPPIRPGTPMPPGRGVLLVDRRPTMVQIAVPSLQRTTTTDPEKV